MSALCRVAFVLSVMVTVAASAAPQSKMASRGSGMSVDEFRGLAASLPALPGRIEAIRLFREPDNSGKLDVAFATYDTRGGWQISIFGSSAERKFHIEWQSGKLGDSFSVSSPDSLSVFDLGWGQTIEFEGCAPHVCPDVFSVLMYVPSKRTAYIANYVWGKVTYSPRLKSPQELRYKAALEQLMRDHRSK